MTSSVPSAERLSASLVNVMFPTSSIVRVAKYVSPIGSYSLHVPSRNAVTALLDVTSTFVEAPFFSSLSVSASSGLSVVSSVCVLSLSSGAAGASASDPLHPANQSDAAISGIISLIVRFFIKHLT